MLFKFTFESTFETKAELREEISRLLWQIDGTWPMNLSPELVYMKEKIDQGWVKVNGGSRRQSIGKGERYRYTSSKE